MINVPSLIDIIHDGLNQLTDADKKSIKYQIESSRISPSLYIYKTTASGSLNILRVSDHLPHMQGLVRDGNIPRPSADDGANVSIDFYIPKKAEPIGKASEKKRKKFIKNEFKNFVGVPITIPTVKPFTVTSYEYSYKNLEQQDEMIIWHCIATWISCLKPDRVFHDPFAQDKVKKAKVETKIANVKVFGDTVEITESKSNKNMKKTVRLNEEQFKKIVAESVKKVIAESMYGDEPFYKNGSGEYTTTPQKRERSSYIENTVDNIGMIQNELSKLTEHIYSLPKSNEEYAFGYMDSNNETIEILRKIWPLVQKICKIWGC